MIDRTNFTIDCFLSATVVSQTNWSGYEVERRDHLIYAMTKVTHAGDILEFGVYRGNTISQIARFFPDRKIWGFDSFEGLPEDWLLKQDTNNIKFPKGVFGLERMPWVPDNVTLVKGWFQDTIPSWKSHNTKPISLLHIDCDLYSSTRDVFSHLNTQIVPGTVIVFDDMYTWSDAKNYELWHQGEYLALKQWIEINDRAFEVLSRNRYMQCAIKVVR
jgi:predicted O-methyltransferase YrrM